MTIEEQNTLMAHTFGGRQGQLCMVAGALGQAWSDPILKSF